MLDFISLQQQLTDMVGEQKFIHRHHIDKIELARNALEEWASRWRELATKATKGRTSWLLATDIQTPLDRRFSLPVCPSQITAIATDGSQIFPDRHEFSSCHLINIGSVVLHYGSAERPFLSSQPLLFFRDDDIHRDWNGKRIAVNEEMISALRGAFEIRKLAELVAQAVREHRKTIGIVDGTLILWKLEGKPRPFQQEILHYYLHAFEQMKLVHAPIMGYISQPASADLINVLRVGLCPENPVNCDKCPYKGKQSELPCEPIEGVTDAMLLATMLEHGDRSAVFKSASTILSEYGEHAVYFFYTHVGPEIVRIEIPKWVAEQSELLNFVHAVAYSQAQKGQGYPVSLAEAHEQAIIRSHERGQFYRILEQMYVREGLPVNVSRKILKKRNVSI